MTRVGMSLQGIRVVAMEECLGRSDTRKCRELTKVVSQCWGWVKMIRGMFLNCAVLSLALTPTFVHAT